MAFKKIQFLFLSIIIYVNTILPSVISGSLIKTPHGFVEVENIAIGDMVVGSDQESLSIAVVTHISTTTTDTLIVITTKKGSLYASPDQQFFDPILQQWVAAKNITTQTTFLDAQLNHCTCLNVEIINVPATKTYRITTTSPHNFFITEQELLTHNALPIVIGLAWLFGEGLKFAGLTIGTTLLGSYVGVQLYNSHKQKQKEKNFNITFEVSSGGYTPDPDDDENNERKFNTITKTEFFKTVEKHYERWRGNIYKRKSRAKGIEDAEYLEWDYTHNDVEAYSKSKCHIGSIDPRTLRLYKPPVYNRQFPGR